MKGGERKHGVKIEKHEFYSASFLFPFTFTHHSKALRKFISRKFTVSFYCTGNLTPRMQLEKVHG